MRRGTTPEVRNADDAKDETEWFRRKMAIVDFNLSDLRRAMEKKEERSDSTFLTRETVDAIGPWRRDHF